MVDQWTDGQDIGSIGTMSIEHFIIVDLLEKLGLLRQYQNWTVHMWWVNLGWVHLLFAFAIYKAFYRALNNALKMPY